MSSIKIAKIERSESYVRDESLFFVSLFDEGRTIPSGRYAVPVRDVVRTGVRINCKADEIEEVLCKRCDALLVSEVEFNEFVSQCRSADAERAEKHNSAVEAREEEQFYVSLSGIRLKIYNDLGLEGTAWKKASVEINDEFRRRYLNTPVTSYTEYMWEPGR